MLGAFYRVIPALQPDRKTMSKLESVKLLRNRVSCVNIDQ